MKTIELTIPTSIKDIEIKKPIVQSVNTIKLKLAETFDSLSLVVGKWAEKILELFSSLNKISFTSGRTDRIHSTTRDRDGFMSKLKSWRPSKKHTKFFVYLVLLVALVTVARSVLKSSVKSDSDTGFDIEGPKQTTTIDRSYQFPFYDETGEVISDFEYIIERAELRDEVLIQGRPAQAIQGKTFLVIYIKIKNEYQGSLQLNASEYVRLIVNGNEDELLAPDMNSDPVQIQAISTKTTRIGFPIDDENVDDLKLQIGEVDGEKDIFEINF